MVGTADMMLRSKVCIADVTAPFYFNLQSHFKFCAKHTFKVQVCDGKREIGGGRCWDVSFSYGALIEKNRRKWDSIMLQDSLGKQEEYHMDNTFFRVLSPAWSRHNMLQPSELGSIGQNSFLPTRLGSSLCFLCFRAFRERQSHVQALPLSLPFCQVWHQCYPHASSPEAEEI